MRARSRILLVLLSLAVIAGCRAAADAVRQPADSRLTRDWFKDESQTTGLTFVHANGMSGRFYFHEMMGSGAALFDYDNDGDLDVLLVQGTGAAKLYRNDLVVGADGSRRLSFTDVTAASGLTTTGYGMGVATGDVDNDGCVDVYLTNFGRNQFFHNNCDGTFTDVTTHSGTGGSGWSVSATFVDYDRDGWLDLFVGHYVAYAAETSTPCFSLSGRPDYCSPNAYRPEQNHLYHNNHDGTFTDVTVAAGLAGNFGPTLGVVADDFDGDGWVDLYVANDGRENQLWINRHDGTFRNAGLLSGTAITADAKATGSMGVDAADIDGDGADDLLVTTLTGEGTSLFFRRGPMSFEDASAKTGIRGLSLGLTGFGVHALDIDNDSRLDLLSVNGAVRTIESLAQTGDRFPLSQRRQLLHNLGGGRFEDVTGRAGPSFAIAEVGRGAAFGDIDNDGDTDVIVTNNNGPVRLFINQIGNRAHWVGLSLVSSVRSVRLRADNRPAEAGHNVRSRVAVGARVEILRPNQPPLLRRAATDGSYASASDPRVLVGLGDSAEPPSICVTWPDGRVERWNRIPIDRYTTLVEGAGQ